MAARAVRGRHEAHHVFAVGLGFGFFHVVAEEAEDAVKAEAGALRAGWSVEQEVLLGFLESLERKLQVDFELFGRKLHCAQQILRGGTRPEAAVEERFAPVGDHAGWIEVEDGAQAVALGAGAVVGVKAEGARLELGDVDAAIRAGHGRGVEGFGHRAAAGGLQADENQAVAECERGGDRGLQTLGVEEGPVGPIRTLGVRRQRLQDDAVDDGFQGVVFALFEAHALFDLGHFAVDAQAVALFIESFDLLAKLAFAAAHDGGQHGDTLAGRFGLVALDDLTDDLVGALARDQLVAVGAVWLAHRSPQKPQIVVDFRDCADGGARRARGGLLLDGDGGREAIDGVDIGPLHLVEELARVGGKRFNIAALAFGVDRVKGE